MRASKITDAVADILVCPYCMGSLGVSDRGADCRGCSSHYNLTESGALDVRLQKPKMVEHTVELGKPVLLEPELHFGRLPEKLNPEVGYRGVAVPHHLSKEMLSYFPKAGSDTSLMLDLGCGSTVHRAVCEHAGFEYVGLDHEAEEAQILGDAHALPFRDESFEFVLSIAVLEHIQFPFIMATQAHRVLQPGGLLIGTVAFLEPFHGDSFYHHTHLATYNTLKEGGFRIEWICPNERWPALVAQASMALFPRMPRALARVLVKPLQAIHKAWWRIPGVVSDPDPEGARILTTAGSFTFIARRATA